MSHYRPCLIVEQHIIYIFRNVKNAVPSEYALETSVVCKKIEQPFNRSVDSKTVDLYMKKIGPTSAVFLHMRLYSRPEKCSSLNACVYLSKNKQEQIGKRI